MTSPFAECPDGTLIERSLAGQTECFTILMDRHAGPVKRRISAMVLNAFDADDLFQEVSFKVWRSLSTFRSESSFRTWLTRIAINEALMSHRRQRGRKFYQPPDNFDAFASPGEAADVSLMRAEVTQAVRKAVVALPLKYRQVVMLRDLEQLSVQETAQRLHATIPAVKTRLFRGRLMLLAAYRRSNTRRTARRTGVDAGNLAA